MASSPLTVATKCGAELLPRRYCPSVTARAASPGVRPGAHLLEGAAGQHGLRSAANWLAAGVGLVIVHLDEQPALVPVRANAGEREATAELGPLQPDRDMTMGKRRTQWDLLTSALGHVAKRSCIPDHHRPGAVLALRDGAFEVSILEGMVLGGPRQPLVSRIE